MLTLVLGASVVAVTLAFPWLTVREEAPSQPPTTSAPSRPPEKAVNRAGPRDVRATEDAFGITMIQPTLPRGTLWVSDWSTPRSFSGVDPQDPWFDADHGSGSYRAGAGLLSVSGEAPRMYVHDPAMRRQWRDVEVTVYFQRVADGGVPYAGMTAVARANHLETESGTDALCDTRGYGGRLRSDGYADFEKETAHPENDTVNDVVVWRRGMPLRRWIGYKFLVFDKRDGVHLELWMDRTNGRNGGDWVLVNRVIDNGRLFGRTPCAPGINPRLALTNDARRAGSESGRPNVSVYFRSDRVRQDGLLYKWASIREISVR